MLGAPEELGDPVCETKRDGAALPPSRASGRTKQLSPSLSSHEKGIPQTSCAVLQQGGR